MAKTKITYNPNVSPEANQEIEEAILSAPRTAGSGIGCTERYEYVPEFIAADAENVISKKNAYIVLGRDRPGARTGGYGGIGAAAAHSVDVVVGRKSYGKNKDPDTGRLFVDPDFRTDAARIYISERTDLDENFGIVPGDNGSSINASGIGIKADAVRIIGDQGGIKLVTRVNKKNTHNQTIDFTPGVEIIAGNNDNNLQPMVLGRNLQICLKDIIGVLSDLGGAIAGLVKEQMIFEAALLAHVHPPAAPSPTLPPSVAKKLAADGIAFSSMVSFKANIASLQANYLNAIPGGNYILSEYNKNN